jgi:hypothetical protein
MRLRCPGNAFPDQRSTLVHQLSMAPLASHLRIGYTRLTSRRDTIAFSRSRTRECEGIERLSSAGPPSDRLHRTAYTAHFPKLPCLAYVPEASSGRTLRVGTATDRTRVDDGQTAFQWHGVVGGRERDGLEMQWGGLCFPQLLRP